MTSKNYSAQSFVPCAHLPLKELKSSTVTLVVFRDSPVSSVLTLIPKMHVEDMFVHGPKLKLSMDGFTKPFALNFFKS